MLYFAHYGHPILKGAKHGSFLLSEPGSTAYQITGSTDIYEIKRPEVLRPDSEQMQTYTGRKVGRFDDDRRNEFERVVLAVPVTRRSLAWKCQNWIVEGLAALNKDGYGVEAYRLEDLQKLLAESLK
ncbi:hypothetical protein DAEQUDRAFT_726232 [Daedalea quercina L-15889]|uniref:Uncharacterized protein n=1 Tax=Daedalea quercina L-15889 TaxID=1314783 RepID=A0A165QLC2_9APHY|nr:hypothetical protein DAEQUDRAFT_726232 [Daedalea quercina L-15889]